MPKINVDDLSRKTWIFVIIGALIFTSVTFSILSSNELIGKWYYIQDNNLMFLNLKSGDKCVYGYNYGEKVECTYKCVENKIIIKIDNDEIKEEYSIDNDKLVIGNIIFNKNKSKAITYTSKENIETKNQSSHYDMPVFNNESNDEQKEEINTNVSERNETNNNSKPVTSNQAQEQTQSPAPSIENKPAVNNEPSVSVSKQNALKKAQSYLSYLSFSYLGLIEQLGYEKYSNEDAVYAVDNCGANWDEQALKKAKSYLTYSSFSYSGLIEQLEYEKYTSSQAQYAVNNCGADWNEQAVKKAQSYLSHSAFSRDGLIEQLEFEGFTNEQAIYGVNATGL